MAMLAEPRQRKRYNLVPRGKALYEDDSRYGTKMLEKMGWSKGKGLGAKEDGSKEFVRIRYKNDVQGLGFEDRDDQWTQHEQHFNGLLQQLNGSGGEENQAEENEASEDEGRPAFGLGFASTIEAKKADKLKEKFSGESLEEKSKKSKARVHYKKFTRGKDLARYSEKDLANIFGKKALDEVTAKELTEEQVPSPEPVEEKNAEEIPDNFAGVPTVSTGVSVSDYFKAKMEALKAKRLNGVVKGGENPEANNNAQESKKEKKTKKRAREENDEVVRDEAKAEAEEVEFSQSKKKKKKKDKKENRESCYLENPAEPRESKGNDKPRVENEALEVKDETITECTIKPKKSKKSKRKDADEDVPVEPVPEPADEQPLTEKKKKKSKHVGIEQDIGKEEENLNLPLATANQIEKVKKNKKKKSKETELSPPDEDTEPPSKKFKKNKAEKEEPTSGVVESQTQEPIGERKKSKKKNQQTQENMETPPEELSSNEPEKKRKKKKDKALDLNEVGQGDVNVKVDKKKKRKGDPANTEDTALAPSSTHLKEVSEDCPSDSDNDTDSFIIKLSKRMRPYIPLEFYTLTVNELQQQVDELNKLRVSSFCAEKFRNINDAKFQGSNLSELIGYGYDTENDIELDIRKAPGDEERITQLWSCKLNKYAMHEEYQYKYRKYVKECIKAKKQKAKRPKFHTKIWKRKNAFKLS